MSIILDKIEGFEWDEGNSDKNQKKHQVSRRECEEIFFNQPLLMLPDPTHSQKEQRYHALGHTDHDRFLFLTFTVRRDLIRVISARSMSKKEKIFYEKQ